jgi:hypothetical protein
LAALSKELADAANGTQDSLLSRAALAVEELGEWLAANGQGDLLAAGDALGDRMYVLIGDAVASGLPLDLIFEAVHESNVTKLPLVQTGFGRAVRGPSYFPPDIATALEAQALGRNVRRAEFDA